MDTKLASTISRIQQDRGKGNHARAMKRIADAVKSHPGAIELYQEAIDTCVETGASLGAIDYLKDALARFPAEHDSLVALAHERAGARGDAAVAKFLVDHQVKRRDLSGALATTASFPDRTVRDLVQRAHMKRNTLTSAARGGHAVSDELITNMLSEVVMNARLGRNAEAAAVTGEILDSHSDDEAIVSSLDTFLEGLGETAAHSAPVLFARARCAILSSRHIDGAHSLVSAVAIDPALGPDALDLLRGLESQFDETPVPVEDAQVEIFLITGEHDSAAKHLRARLDTNPGGSAVGIVERIGRYLPPGGDVTALHVVFLDAAVEADLMNRVYDALHALAQVDGNRARLLEWLNVPDRARFLSAPVMTLHAELTIEDGDFEGAARILRSLCSYSSEAVPGVMETLRRHRSRDAALEDLFTELSAAAKPHVDTVPAVDPTDAPASISISGGGAARGEGDPLGLEHFENNEFRFTTGAPNNDDAAIVSEEKAPPAIRSQGGSSGELGDFSIYDGTNILGGATGSSAASARPVASAGVGGRRPLDTEKAGIIWDEEGDDDDAPPPQPLSPEFHLTEEHVRNVAGALYASGARTFFYIEDETPATSIEPEPAIDEQTHDDVAPEPEETPLETTPEELPVAEIPEELQGTEELEARAEPEELEMPEALEEPWVPVAFEEPEELDTSAGPDADATEELEVPAETEAFEESEEIEEPGELESSALPEAVEPEVTGEDTEATEEERGEPAVAEMSFGERFALFQDNRLEAGDVVDLMEEAVARHDTDALGRLVENAPRDDEHEARVGLCEVEWYLTTSHPAEALEVLRRLRSADLDEDQRKTVWLRTVECQRMQRDYDAAHLTLVELVKLYPDCPDVDGLARMNYRDYLENYCTDAPVLEKVTSLDGDS